MRVNKNVIYHYFLIIGIKVSILSYGYGFLNFVYKVLLSKQIKIHSFEGTNNEWCRTFGRFFS